MKDMDKWLSDLKAAQVKKALPVLSFPAIQKMGITVRQLINSSDYQAQAMKIVADSTNSAAAVSLMDLSVEAECFGSEIAYSDDEVPTVRNQIVTSEEEARALRVPCANEKRCALCIDAISKASQLIKDRPIFAGVIGSFSLAGRLVGVSDAMVDCYDEPEMMKIVLEKTTDFIIDYCSRFKKAGADGVVIAEPLTGLLSPSLAWEFSTPYIKRIVDEVSDKDFLVIYHNCGNSTISIIDSILATGAKALHFGNAISMEDMMPHIPSDIVAMGNVDPAREFKNGTPSSVRAATLDVMGKCCKYPNFVISSGCDIPPMSKWENIEAFFAAVDEFYHN